MSVTQTFAERFRHFRCVNGYKMHELAKLLEVSIPTISSYERGTRMPTILGLVEIAKLFHCSTDYLLGLENEKSDLVDLRMKVAVMKKRLNELEELFASR